MPSDRILPIQFSNMLQPARCFLCRRIGRDNQEMFADTQLSIEWEGAVYICEDCTNDLIALFGGAGNEKFIELNGKLDNFVKENIQLQSRIIELENVIDNLTSERLISRGVIGSDTVNSNPEDASNSLVPDFQEPISDNQGIKRDESESDQSSSEYGPDDSDELASIRTIITDL